MRVQGGVQGKAVNAELSPHGTLSSTGGRQRQTEVARETDKDGQREREREGRINDRKRGIGK